MTREVQTPENRWNLGIGGETSTARVTIVEVFFSVPRGRLGRTTINTLEFLYSVEPKVIPFSHDPLPLLVRFDGATTLEE